MIPASLITENSRMIRTHSFRHVVILSLMLLALGRAIAADGVIDIAPAGTGAFLISTPGSYRLVRNFTTTDNAHGIVIAASDVTLDLGGHTITGNGVGNAIGITMSGGFSRGKVFNGTILQFNLGGIVLEGDSIIEDCIVKSCGVAGIYVSANSKVTDCEVIGTTGTGRGIQTTSGTVISNCRVNGSTGNGIQTGDNAIIENCTLIGNNTAGNNNGISAGSGSIVRGNKVASTVAASGVSKGILVGDHCQVLDNNVTGTASSGAVWGISTGNYCRVIGNTSNSNVSSGSVSYGIDAGANCLVTDNDASENKGSSFAAGIDCNGGGSVLRNSILNNSCTQAGDAMGIFGSSYCIYADNSIQFNTSGPSDGVTAYGISGGDNNQVFRNLILSNSAAGPDGSSYGISVNNHAQIADNQIVGNEALGTGNANGILMGYYSRVTDNIVNLNLAPGAGSSTGILTEGTGSLISGNNTSGHDPGRGLFISTGPNVIERNRCLDGFTIHASNPAPTADNANIDF